MPLSFTPQSKVIVTELFERPIAVPVAPQSLAVNCGAVHEPLRWFAGSIIAMLMGTFITVAVTAILTWRSQGTVAAMATPGSYQHVPERIGAIDVDPAIGRQLYARSCASCHGANGAGMPEQGVALRGSAFVLGTADASLLSFVKLGRPAQDRNTITGRAMPPKGGDRQLSQQDLADIVAYLRSLQEPPASRG